MKTLFLPSVFVLGLLLIPQSGVARPFTNSAGKTIEADLLRIETSSEGKVAVLKLENGQVARVPASSLSKEDQEFLAGQEKNPAASSDPKPSDSNPTTTPSGEPSIFKELLEGKLVALDGKRVSRFEMDSDPEYYAFYFSAHWCPPCREFTPKLVKFYNDNDAAGKKFEIIFVSSDRDERSMEDYIEEDQMPWPAIKYRYAKKIKEIRQYAGRGIPCLVLVDRKGEVISHSYEGDNYIGPTKVMGDIAAKVR